MKTSVRDTSIDAYYEDILANGKELDQVARVIKYVVTHPCCTRREIAEHFHRLNDKDPLGQEARVAARVNKALKLRINNEPVIVESEKPVKDSKTSHSAYTLWPSNYGRQRSLPGIQPQEHHKQVSP